ncbi:polysaccharide deacetylase [Flavobacterium sp. 90]|uniref:polysaccharide deacetylase family protein n=1 Tax=unclassified Flavobacterium TaxID=196869 RepID=UPI000EAFE913|nr:MULTISPECIES: polysaccharide deacetylase family protein [unclassified Flavobacterium]RKR08354.1 polysaccharide deacetylase [Flavobacterium sp. 81]TCK57542.1 polysaccharide deacetylase [Flavobacterium sp. 90]
MSKLPILMYHNVCQSDSDCNKLTVSVQNLERQFQYLTEKGYKTFHFSELNIMKAIPKKSIILTFDDVTENQLIYALPLLEKFKLKASFFIPFQYIGKTDLWNESTGEPAQKIMTIEQLKQLPSEIIELGYHSYQHNRYQTLSPLEIQNDFLKCEEEIKSHNLNVYPALAYPYGNYPKESTEKANFKTLISENKMKFGLKIGNRPNTFPFKDNYEVKRIDIKGLDSLMVFKLKIKFGKLKLF